VISLAGVKLEETTEKRDRDFGTDEKYIPCGIVDQDSGQLYLVFGSSAKTSDFIVDTLQQWWNDLTPDQQQATERIQIKVDNGPESSGVRTQLLKRMVEITDHIGKPIHLLYYPPYHSKYNPIERCWNLLEKHAQWCQAYGCTHYAFVGTEYDLESFTSHREVEPQDL
jgi:hypothetical protein